MSHQLFEVVVKDLPHLTAEGFVDPESEGFEQKRNEFISGADCYSEAIRVREALSRIPKSERFSDWQRENCDPVRLLAYFEWKTGERVSPGAIIAAAISLGFTMGVRDNHQVYFNFSAPLIESGLAELRTQEQIDQVAKA